MARPPTTSTGSPPTGCSTSTTSGCPVARVQAPGGRPSSIGGRAATSTCRCRRRDYGLAGRLLAEAADRSRRDGIDIQTALDDAAAAEGRRLADEVRSRLTDRGAVRSDGSQATPGGTRGAVLESLEARGFEPIAVDNGTVVLRNCPFHQLAREHAELICGMNHCLLGTMVEVLDDAGLAARLEPEEGVCCVRLHPVG